MSTEIDSNLKKEQDLAFRKKLDGAIFGIYIGPIVLILAVLLLQGSIGISLPLTSFFVPLVGLLVVGAIAGGALMYGILSLKDYIIRQQKIYPTLCDYDTSQVRTEPSTGSKHFNIDNLANSTGSINNETIKVSAINSHNSSILAYSHFKPGYRQRTTYNMPTICLNR